MKRYQLLEDGKIKDIETGEEGIHPGAWQWDRVQAWLDEGNTFLPAKPSEFHILQDDQWVIDELLKRKADDSKAKEEAITAIKEYTKDYSLEEQLTFDTQERESREYLKDDKANVPLISTIAQYRQIPIADLIKKILKNVDDYKLAIGQILGTQQKKIDDLYKEKPK